MLNRKNTDIYYNLGRLFGLATYVTFGTQYANSIKNKMDSYVVKPKSQFGFILKTTEREIPTFKNGRKDILNRELREILWNINSEKIDDKIIPLELQRNMQMGLYHEKSYLFGEK